MREQSGSLVIGDVVAAESGQRTRSGTGSASPRAPRSWLEWSGGELRWQADDLAVISAVYD